MNKRHRMKALEAEFIRLYQSSLSTNIIQQSYQKQHHCSTNYIILYYYVVIEQNSFEAKKIQKLKLKKKKKQN